MMKYLAISLFFVTCVRSDHTETDYYERRYDSPSDNNLEEMFLRQFLDEIKPFISPIVEEWNHRLGFPNIPGRLFEHLITKYVPTSRSLSSDTIESFLRQVEEFKTCVDQTLARAAADPALRDIQSKFPDLGDGMKDELDWTDKDEGYSQKQKLSRFRALGDDKSVYSKRFRSSSTTESSLEDAERADYLAQP